MILLQVKLEKFCAVPRIQAAGDQSGTPAALYCSRETATPRGTTLRHAQDQEQQAAIIACEHELAIQESKRQAEEQPELLKLQWRRQLSQQSTCKAEIHELYAEMPNMREKSEMKSQLSARMCSLESPSRSVESEPKNVLNTASQGRSSSWILPTEMMSTPDRPTS